MLYTSILKSLFSYVLTVFDFIRLLYNYKNKLVKKKFLYVIFNKSCMMVPNLYCFLLLPILFYLIRV